MKIIRPLARQPLGRGWILRVRRNLQEPFSVGETVGDTTSTFRIVQIEGTPDPHLVDLIVETAS